MLYESVFPTIFEEGMPSHQYLIVFFTVKLSTNYQETPLNLQACEVDISVWIHRKDLSEILQGKI